MAACHDVLIIDTAGFGNQAAAMATGSADMVLIPVMPDRDSVHEVAKTARQAQALGQMARRTIPVRVVKSRWRAANLAERATLDDLRTAGLELLDQHLSDLTEYQKMSFTGLVPVSGRIGDEVGSLIAELVALGAIPSLKKTKVAA